MHNFNSCNSSAKELLSPFFKDEETDFKKLSKLPKVTELASG